MPRRRVCVAASAGFTCCKTRRAVESVNSLRGKFNHYRHGSLGSGACSNASEWIVAWAPHESCVTALCRGAFFTSLLYLPEHRDTLGSSLKVLQAATRDSQSAKGQLSQLELCRAASFLRDGSAGAEDGQDRETCDACPVGCPAFRPLPFEDAPKFELALGTLGARGRGLSSARRHCRCLQ